MEKTHNPFLEPENYLSGYQENIDDLRNRPELVAFEKLCHAVFTSPDGKELMKYLEENYLMMPAADPAHPKFETMCVWKDGVNHLPLVFKRNVKSHEQRIKAGTTT